jgi:hypothetical protein
MQHNNTTKSQTQSPKMETVMPTRLSAAIASLHETRNVDFSHQYFSANEKNEKINAKGAPALADALKVNTSVTTIDLWSNQIGNKNTATLADALKINKSVTAINLYYNGIGVEGASALADALKVNTSLTRINLGYNEIGDVGASALADALKVNTSLTTIDVIGNRIGDEGAAALVDALQVNTSVTSIDLYYNAIDKSNRASINASINALVVRNYRFRSLFLFDARQMLLSLMCADECGVVWPYLLGRGDTDGIIATDAAETIRAEFLSDVVAERRRRLQASTPGAKRRRLE